MSAPGEPCSGLSLRGYHSSPDEGRASRLVKASHSGDGPMTEVDVQQRVEDIDVPVAEIAAELADVETAAT